MSLLVGSLYWQVSFSSYIGVLEVVVLGGMGASLIAYWRLTCTPLIYIMFHRSKRRGVQTSKSRID